MRCVHGVKFKDGPSSPWSSYSGGVRVSMELGLQLAICTNFTLQSTLLTLSHSAVQAGSCAAASTVVQLQHTHYDRSWTERWQRRGRRQQRDEQQGVQQAGRAGLHTCRCIGDDLPAAQLAALPCVPCPASSKSAMPILARVSTAAVAAFVVLCPHLVPQVLR